MPVYEFRCSGCGRFEAQHTMATVPESQSCPSCSAESQRMITAVGLSGVNSPRARAVEQAARSAAEPEVVRGSPRRSRRSPVSSDPRHRNLPKP